MIKQIELICASCLKVFTRKPSLHKHSVARGGDNYKPTCSVTCANNIQKKLHKYTMVVCAECGVNCEKEVHTLAINKNSFCSRSCSAIFSNRETPRKRTNTKSSGTCEKCNSMVIFNKKTTGGYAKRRFCDACRYDNICNISKINLFTSAKNWQSARSSIQKQARRIYTTSDKPKKCHVCNYSRHFEVCHIKDVSSFDDSALILEINDINNLVALCPTHHWEFDNGLLSF